MVDLNDNLGWVPVVRIETSDVALGSNETNQPNKALKELASRDAFILDLLAEDSTAQATFEAFKQAGIAAIAQGRLTLESNVAVSSADQLAQTTLYYTPYIGDQIALYDTVNTRWDLRTFTQRSISLASALANTVYDVFAFWDGDSVELELVAWTSGTARNIAISQLDGIWVKSTDSRRYLGTIFTQNAGECEDSAAKRCVFNAQNREPRSLAILLSGSNYSYTSTVWRAANNNLAASRVIACTGLPGVVTSLAAALVTQSENVNTLKCPGGNVSISLNSSSVPASIANSGRPNTEDSLTLISIANLTFPIGFNYAAILEFGFDGNGSTTGDFVVVPVGSGMGGIIQL